MSKGMYSLFQQKPKNTPWNKGKLVGQKVPLKLKEAWALRIHLQIAAKHRELLIRLRSACYPLGPVL
jgi:hypothetical protein